MATELLGMRVLGVTHCAWASACGAVLILVVAAPADSRLARCGESRWLQFFGKYSYAMYVFQLPLIYLLAPLVTAGGLAALLGNAWLGQVAYCGILYSVTTAAAVGSWHLFEKHWLALKHRFGG